MVAQTKVFVGSLPQGTKPEELRKLFERFGVVTECDIMNRCGFVHMQTEEQASAAIRSLHNTNFNGGVLTVERGRIKERGARPGGPGNGPRGGGPGRGGMGRGGPRGGGGMRNGGGMERRGGGGPMRGGHNMGVRDAPYSRDRMGRGGGMGMRNGMGGGYDRGMGGGYDRGMDRQMGGGGYVDDRYGGGYEDRRGFALMDRGSRPDPYGSAPVYEDHRGYAPEPVEPAMYDDRRPMYPDERDMMDRRPMRGGPPMGGGYDRAMKPAPMGNGDNMYSRRSPMRGGGAPVGYDRDPYGQQYPPLPRGGGGAARGRDLGGGMGRRY